MKKLKATHILIILSIVLIALVSILKYKGDNFNYHNSDATWHTLLTMKAYDETPVSKHLFLPIISLGEESDKNISWGLTIPDEDGNYYYTSFSPAGFVTPYLFVKTFNMPINQQSLYIFNTVIFAISCGLWIVLLSMIYGKNKKSFPIVAVGALTYIFSPELLHGLGTVYWHQSIMQVTLLLQIIFYYRYINSSSKVSKYLFYLFALLNPYIEWTGYVANVGFALAELIRNWKTSKKKGLLSALTIGLITLCSMIIFVLHYLLRVDAKTFFEVSKNRFMARNITTGVVLSDVFCGYIKSFLYIWVVLLILTVLNFIKNKKVELRNGILIMVLSFPLLENILMKEHAVSYSYDRMKLIFLLSFIICELVYNIVNSKNCKKYTGVIIVGIVSIFSFLNFTSYNDSNYYNYEVDFIENNNKIAKYINDNYGDSIIIAECNIRGYMNLLFNRGIYEFLPLESAIEMGNNRNTKYVVKLNIDYNSGSDVYKLSGADIYDLKNEDNYRILIKNNEIIKAKID